MIYRRIFVFYRVCFFTVFTITRCRFRSVLRAGCVVIRYVVGIAMSKFRVYVYYRIRFLTIFTIANRRFRSVLRAGCVVIRYVVGIAMSKFRVYVYYRIRFLTIFTIANRRFRSVLRAGCVIIGNVVCENVRMYVLLANGNAKRRRQRRHRIIRHGNFTLANGKRARQSVIVRLGDRFQRRFYRNR